MARELWGSKLGFILAAVGSAIGLGNIWRFPYMVYSNGGGAFLIPYFVALFCVGIPLLLLEFSVGHSTKGSAPLAFKRINEKSEWVGWLAVFSGFTITTYYMVIIGWCLYYLYNILLNGFPLNFKNYFFGNILSISPGAGSIDGFSMGVLVSTGILWLINYVIIRLGVKNGLEKANKIFMPTLFILTLILLIRGISLPGAFEGLNWYLTPNFGALLNFNVWISAFSQIFYSLTLGFGVMIVYASYLPKKVDLTTSAFTVALLNCGYSFLAGLAVFSTLGYMAYTTGLPLNEVVNKGIVLAFVVFPKALSMIPYVGWILAIVFFLALIVAGLSSSISLVEAVTSSIMEKFEISRKKAITTVTTFGFLGSLVFTTKAGLYWLDITDHFASGYLLPIVGCAEAIVALWIFKGDKLLNYLNKLSDIKLGKYWKMFAGILTPILLLTIVGLDIFSLTKAPYGGYPWKYLDMGILLVVVGFLSSVLFSKIPWKRKIKSWDELNRGD
ncbi:sodium-dependent transporter [Methanothermococcus sp.]|uniref:sodium-dependent transporter n=1 Tax=Methanothermococcus sp. TaxID=2614238 RepID=UPI0025FADC71|nr:sodium-dependent transporter [Methanothermococcus sp.]